MKSFVVSFLRRVWRKGGGAALYQFEEEGSSGGRTALHGLQAEDTDRTDAEACDISMERQSPETQA